MDLLAVAMILKPRGVRGEVWVERYRDGFPRFETGGEVWVSSQEQEGPFQVEGFFEYAKGCVLKLVGVDGPERAKALSGRELCLPAHQVPEDGPDEFEPGEVAGWTMVDGRRGPLGRVTGAVPGPAYWIFLVQGPGGDKIEVPAVKGYGVELDRARREIRLDLPEGYPGVDRED